jgi:nucleoid DNA-binding protein
MIKIDLVRELAQKLKIKDKEALCIIDNLIDAMKDTIIKYHRLEIRDFGVFEVKKRKQRIGRNPKNKKEYPIPSHKAVTFKSGKEIKEL